VVVSTFVLCFCFACLRLVYPMLSVSLVCPFLIGPSIFTVCCMSYVVVNLSLFVVICTACQGFLFCNKVIIIYIFESWGHKIKELAPSITKPLHDTVEDFGLYLNNCHRNHKVSAHLMYFVTSCTCDSCLRYVNTNM
jgi:hypothetical protein